MDEIYSEWKRDKEDREKETTTVLTLCETLTQGLYHQSPHIVFKVIGEIRFELATAEALNKLALSLV